MFRSTKRDVPPEPWRQRLIDARAIIGQHRGDELTANRLDQVEASLAAAVEDRAAIEATLAKLDPDRVAAELKAALRATTRSERHIETLRLRHETVHGLANRRDDLDTKIQSTIADVETLAARTANLALGGGGGGVGAVDAELEQLHLDVTTLAEAHAELASLNIGLEGRL